MYDFDHLESRKGTWSLKYDYATKRNRPENILPLWVADMDFPAPKEVLEAMIERCNHGIFGYSEPNESYFQSVKSWFKRRHQLEVDSESIFLTPGVVFALNIAIRALTEVGDHILIQQPVYYPFFMSIENNQRKVVNSPLLNKDGHYEIDFEDFERKIVENDVKMFILCSPHNPVGRVWTKEELERVGDICLKHRVWVVSDEIHCDFVAKGYHHIPFVSIKEEYRDITVTCTAPSKTFNLAGLHHSNIFISNPKIKEVWKKEMSLVGGSNASLMGLIACKAAYDYGEVWLEEVKTYIQSNFEMMKEFLEKELPKVKVIEKEGTYLVWLDFRALGLSQQELEHKMVYEANLWLDGGEMFGTEGEGFQRVNIATNRDTVMKALVALKHTFGNL